MRMKLIATRGLPACGKSERALRWVAENPLGRTRVGTDQIADMLHADLPEGREEEDFGPEFDVQSQIAVRGAIEALLRAGLSVVCDDTNLAPRHIDLLRELAERCDADFEVWDMTEVDVDTCIDRDEERLLDGGRSVGARTIRAKHQLFLRYQPPVTTGSNPGGAS